MTHSIQAPAVLARFPWRPLTWGAAVMLFAAAIVAGFTVDGWLWTATDYVAAAVMIFGAALLVELGLRVSPPEPFYRFAFAGGVLAIFLTVWINLAVGIVGSENDPFNLLYFAALLAMFLAAAAVRLRARGMAAIMFAMALSHFAIAAAAQADGHFAWVIAAFFAAIWGTSGVLFRYAARARSA